MADVFLSYASHDRPRARMIANALTATGLTVWWDRRTQGGKNYLLEIERELAAAGCVVVLWTEVSVRSEWVLAEASEGLERRILVPVFMERVTLPFRFKYIHTVSIFDWQGEPGHEGLLNMLTAVNSLLGRTPAATTEPASPAAPAWWPAPAGHTQVGADAGAVAVDEAGVPPIAPVDDAVTFLAKAHLLALALPLACWAALMLVMVVVEDDYHMLLNPCILGMLVAGVWGAQAGIRFVMSCGRTGQLARLALHGLVFVPALWSALALLLWLVVLR